MSLSGVQSYDEASVDPSPDEASLDPSPNSSKDSGVTEMGAGEEASLPQPDSALPPTTNRTKVAYCCSSYLLSLHMKCVAIETV